MAELLSPEAAKTQEQQDARRSLLEEHRPLPEVIVDDEDGSITSRLRIKNEYIKILLAEFLGTAVLLFIGCAANAQSTLHTSDTTRHFFSNAASAQIGWGLAVTAGIWVALTTSGAHINPAVTLTCAVYKKISWKQVPFYFLGEYLGALFGSALVFGAYYGTIHEYTASCMSKMGLNYTTGMLITTGPCATAGIFGTFPAETVTTGQAVVDLMMSAGGLLLLIFAITDKHNGNVPTWLYAFFVGMTVNALATGWAMNAGGSMNPARDLSPRILTAIAGWGLAPFSANDYFFWIPIVAAHLGGVLGGGLYYVCVGLHLPRTTGHELENIMERKKSYLAPLHVE